MLRISVTGTSNKRHAPVAGFTLIELLVVIVLIGIVSSYVFISIDDGNESRELEAAARLIRQHMVNASHEAILQGQPVGVELQPQLIRFVFPGAKGWVEDAEFSSQARIAINTRWRIRLLDEQLHPLSLEQKPATPMIVFSPDGGSNAFTLTLGTVDAGSLQSISSDGLGLIRIAEINNER